MLKPDGDDYILSYTEEQTMSDEGMMIFFDPQKLTAEQIQQLYDALVKAKPTEEKAYYYFPDINDNHLYSFSYSLTGDNAPNLEQKAALHALLKSLREDYPEAVILGHRDLPDVHKDCPCFDAQQEYRDI